MKVKIGKQTTYLKKDVVVSHMANLLASRSILLGESLNFKKTFLDYKKLCSDYLKINTNFVYKMGSEDWLEDFLNHQAAAQELLLQDVFFKFSDESIWSVSLVDLTDLKIINENIPLQESTRESMLRNPVEVVEWAQNNLTWNQIQDYAILTGMAQTNPNHDLEWPKIKKSIIQRKYR